MWCLTNKYGVCAVTAIWSDGCERRWRKRSSVSIVSDVKEMARVGRCVSLRKMWLACSVSRDNVSDIVHEFQAAAKYETDGCRNTCPTSTSLTEWPPPWPAFNVMKLKAMIYCRSSSPATRHRHTTSPVTTMEPTEWRHAISPAKKKLNPYHPAINSIFWWSYVHFKCSSLHLSGKSFSLLGLSGGHDPFGQYKLKRLSQRNSLSSISCTLVRWWLQLPVSLSYETVRKYFDVIALACLLEVCCQVRHNAKLPTAHTTTALPDSWDWKSIPYMSHSPSLVLSVKLGKNISNFRDVYVTKRIKTGVQK